MRGKKKIKQVRSSFSPKQSYELLRVRISKLEKDVYNLKIKAGLIDPDLSFQDAEAVKK